MKLIFMGTPEFAVPSFEAAAKAHEILAVVTQPDRPKGRGHKLTPSPVKLAALERGIPTLQPERVRDEGFIESLAKYGADCIVVVAFGQILPEAILNMPKFGCINVHGSLLPQYRGAAPIQWAVINGETETGVTTMYMAKGLDTGDMLIKKSFEITRGDTYGSVHDRMAQLGAEALIETLDALADGSIAPVPQDDSKSSYAPMINKDTARIDWSKSAEEIFNLIRGMNPAPAAHTTLKEEPIKIWTAEATEGKAGAAPGEITSVSKAGIEVAAASGGLLIREMQARGGKRMHSADYARGHGIGAGDVFI